MDLQPPRHLRLFRYAWVHAIPAIIFAPNPAPDTCTRPGNWVGEIDTTRNNSRDARDSFATPWKIDSVSSRRLLNKLRTSGIAPCNRNNVVFASTSNTKVAIPTFTNYFSSLQKERGKMQQYLTGYIASQKAQFDLVHCTNLQWKKI